MRGSLKKRFRTGDIVVAKEEASYVDEYNSTVTTISNPPVPIGSVLIVLNKIGNNNCYKCLYGTKEVSMFSEELELL